jgi:NAD(P)-dependent dehydrogenase (short-subunit alcohol dehydrogenase family)
VTALVTGSAGGIGGAIVDRLKAEGFEVRELDLVSGFDVSDPEAWEHVGSVDLACLNAGVVTGESEVSDLTDEQYRRAVGVNVDGVVFGVRRLDRVMPKGSCIVVTASLTRSTVSRSTRSLGSSAPLHRSWRTGGSASRPSAQAGPTRR